MSEDEDARRLADKVLDTPYRDPDDDMSMMCRQFNRAVERAEAAERREMGLREALVEARDFLLDPECTNGPTCDHCNLGRKINRALATADKEPDRG